jgi:hypothetical protein
MGIGLDGLNPSYGIYGTHDMRYPEFADTGKKRRSILRGHFP